MLTVSDHFKKQTVRKLAKTRPTLKWVCRDWMVEPLLAAGVDKRNIHILPPDEWQLYASPINIMVNPFDTVHDAPNCGWRLWKDHHNNLFYATDLATLDGIEAKAYTTYLLEANYREAEIQQRIEEKLEAGGFAYETRAETTHLSWEQATAWLQENMAPWSTWVPMHEHKERGNEDGKSEGNTEGDQV